jgi:hypothetical protein
MIRLPILLLLAWALYAPGALSAQHHSGGSHGGSHSHSGTHSHGGSHSYTPRSYSHVAPAPGTRDSHGRLKRSEEAKRQFERQTGHPHGWPGHVIDHKVPLAEGGADTPSNMQWQTTAEAKAKDKVECGGRKCR